MDDQLAKDQLSLWEKLNRLYGDETDSEIKSEPGSAGDSEEREPTREKSAEDDSSAESGQDTADSMEGESISPPCEDCSFDCKQAKEHFVLSRCKKAVNAAEKKDTLQTHSSRASMGYEKINETCIQCRKSCKQVSRKLNKMLCLGFETQEKD